jgi:hypothetical protein
MPRREPCLASPGRALPGRAWPRRAMNQGSKSASPHGTAGGLVGFCEAMQEIGTTRWALSFASVLYFSEFHVSSQKQKSASLISGTLDFLIPEFLFCCVECFDNSSEDFSLRSMLAQLPGAENLPGYAEPRCKFRIIFRLATESV